jgi:hypothetical protein
MSARHAPPFRSVFLLIPLVLVLAATATPRPGAAQPSADEQGFVSLFDGRDLAGWAGDGVHWSVEGGAITGRTTAETALKGHNTFLVWQGGKPTDFELRARFRLQNHNSGIQYRSKLLDPEKFIVGGYQADIDATGRYIGINYEERGRGILTERGQKVEISPDGKKSVVAELGPKDELVKKIDLGGWNEYTIIARGNHLTHMINGTAMSEVIDNQSSKAATAGIIALQLHAGPPMVVQFKDIRLKELR